MHTYAVPTAEAMVLGPGQLTLSFMAISKIKFTLRRFQSKSVNYE